MHLLLAFLWMANGAMTDGERQWLLEHLESSRAELLGQVETITPEQWAFKPDAQTWSVANIVEHLVRTEGYFQEATKKLLQEAETARLGTANAEGDRKIAAQIADRSKKAKAPEMLVPTNEWPTKEAALGEFIIRREKTLEYLRQTQDGLRAHASAGKNPMDVYQYWVLVSAHTVRHTAQLAELKQHPQFPK